MESDRRRRGLVGHVRVVAILMLVQGAFEVLTAVMLAVMAVAIPPAMMEQQTKIPPANEPPQELIFWIITATYGVMAAASLVVAILHITAGVRNCRFRGRVLGIVALAGGGLASLLTCYCIPTAIALGIYGLIVYLNRSVSEAFRMGESGCSSSEIFTTFQR